MQGYSSSYAMGSGAPYGAVPSYEPLPAPKPARTPLSTKLFTGGMITLFVALLLSIAGVPGHLGYDGNAPGERMPVTSSSPMAINKSMDSNLRWMAKQSDDADGHYVGEITNINDSEEAIPAMLDGVRQMNASVQTIDSKLRNVLLSAKGVSSDMDSMVTASQSSAGKMQSLGTDVDALSSAMGKLGAATALLTERMGDIQTSAQGIADHGTSAALKSAKEMNEALPDKVEAPATQNVGANVGGPVVNTGGQG